MTAADVYRALWRYKLFIVIATAAFLGATWYATSRQAKTYEASTLLRVQREVADPASELSALQAGERLALTYANIVGSGALDERVSRLVTGRIPGGATGVGLSGSRVEESEMFWVRARSHDRVAAQIVANAVPEALRSLIRDTRASRGTVATVKPATRPEAAVAPHMELNIALAVVLGLIFNSALVLFFELFRDRLPKPEAMGEALGYPVLASIPALRLRKLTAAERARDDEGMLVTSQRLTTERGPDVRSER